MFQNGKLYNLKRSKRLARDSFRILFKSDKERYFNVFIGGNIIDLNKGEAMDLWGIYDKYYVDYKEAFNL